MQIAQKLTLPLALSVFAVLGVATLFAARADLQLQEDDIRRDQFITSQLLARSILREAEHAPLDQAIALVDDANKNQNRALFLFLRSTELETKGSLSAADIEALKRGETVFRVDRELWGTASTWLPMNLPDGTWGAVWVQEPLAVQRESFQRIIRTQAASAVALGLLWAAVAIGLGAIIVGQPMRKLTEQAKRIGAGDLTHPLHIEQRDEIGALAQQMNHMCEELLASRKSLEQEMTARAHTEDQLRHADRLNTVGKLASGLAHEVGTPLNVISARARMIEQGEVKGEQAQGNATIIAQQSETIARIIRQLLDFARRTPPSSTHGNLASLASQTIAMLSPLAAKSDVKLELATCPKADGDFDHGQIQQALTNLVMNAVQASPRGAAVQVTVGEAEATPPADLGGGPGKYLALSVQDQGTGISPELLPRIFEPFFTTKEVGEGTGLGLSVAWGLVRDHRGWIAVDSTAGKGSRFTIHLPVERTT